MDVTHTKRRGTERIAYRKKLIKYIEGEQAKFAIYLVLQVDEINKLDTYLPKLIDECADQNKTIEVIGINCTEGLA